MLDHRSYDADAKLFEIIHLNMLDHRYYDADEREA